MAFVWIAAQALCFAHCNFGFAHGGSAQPACHAATPSSACHDDGADSAPNKRDSAASTTCSTLKSALVGGGATALVQPDAHLLYTLAPVALMLDVTAIEPSSVSSRQARPRDWVFTPEVYLGPALHSLAPPSSAA